MPLPKPTTNMDWTDGDAAKQVEPSAGKKLLGWVALERPPFETMNFLFFNTDEWIKYLESVTDATLGALVVVVDAGGGGNFLTLQAAHDDAGTVAGTKIIIVSDLTISVVQSLSKPDIEIECRNGKRLIRDNGAGAGLTAIQITATADRIRLKHVGIGRAGNAFDQAGDEALNIAAGCNDAYIDNVIFGPGNTTDEVDAGANTVFNQPQNPSA